MNIDDNPVSELHYGNDLRSELSIRLKKFIPFDFSLSFSDAILNFEKKIKIFKNFK